MILDYEIVPDAKLARHADYALKLNGFAVVTHFPYIRKTDEQNPGTNVYRIVIEDADWEKAKALLAKHHLLPS